MVSSVSGSTGGLSNWADSVFSKLDTKNQGYIDKTDLASALSATGESEGSGDTSAVDDMFGALDGDSDGKVTKSELTDAMTRLADQLNAQFDASRVNGGTDGTDGTSSTSADYVAAADTDGDGTVSEAEQATAPSARPSRRPTTRRWRAARPATAATPHRPKAPASRSNSATRCASWRTR
jgi:Ca2+-binding EF-hand superfamily protein